PRIAPRCPWLAVRRVLLRGGELLVDPGFRCCLVDAARDADLAREELARLEVECPLARRELRRCSGRGLALLASHAVADDLRELERVAAAELLLRLLDALRPDLVAHDRVFAQRLLDALEIGLRRGRAELLLCPRERKRHGEVV